MAPEEEEEYSLEEKFDAAVKVIWTLPEDGPFQPSDDMMLMFYSYYKQATLGPCNVSRPTGFWDSRGKAKWDAWSALGNMTREEAMEHYVEDIQLILETVPISSEVTDLVKKLGNFFTEVESNEEDEENEVDKRPFTRPFAGHTDVQAMISTIQGFGDLWDDIQNCPETVKDDQSVASDELQHFKREHRENEEEFSDGEYRDEEEMEGKGWNPDPMLLMVENRKWESDNQGSNCSSVDPSVSSFTTQTHSSLNSEAEEEELAYSLQPAVQCNSYTQSNGHLSDHRLSADINVRVTDSDNEEFCDSMEHLAMDEGPSTSKVQIHEMSTDDFHSAMSRRWTGLNVNAACCCLSQSSQSLCSTENINEQIAAALLRLQHDMDSVLNKLQTLELIQTSQPPSPLQDLHPLAAALQFIKLSWWPSHSSITVFFTVIWPVFAHWLVQLYLQRRRRIT